MNNPFDYTPSDQMLQAQQTLIAHIESLREDHPEFREEVDKGKMFGILSAKEGVFFAFSGQIANRYDWAGFVAPVFDYLAPDGYFKTHEAEITNINNKVYELEHSAELAHLINEHRNLDKEAKADIEDYKQKMQAAKTERDLLRQSGYGSDSALIKESQFMKAELHRRKVHWRSLLELSMQKIEAYEAEIRYLKLQRQHKSDKLQRWLFQQFVFTNQQGESRSLMDLSYPMTMPPSGSGECCEPKLLNHAFTHKLTPLEMGMFWWGESPRQEIRHHLQFYPACNGKCKPIMEFLLERRETRVESGETRVETLFEDESIIVVNKPAGLLSVPGKSDAPSVFSILKAQHPDLPELQMVHRLDMDTSGLLVVAKTKQAHKHLQRQFAEHSIHKEYVAVLERTLSAYGISPSMGRVDSREGEEKICYSSALASEAAKPSAVVLSKKTESGEIRLPLRPDYEDRPRQLVDYEHGHEAVTHYEFISDDVVRLIPETGRTHQLRVHCAHEEGLGRPIKGDRLYGKCSDRLYLHAATLVFTHPQTGERLSFHTDSGFIK